MSMYKALENRLYFGWGLYKWMAAAAGECKRS